MRLRSAPVATLKVPMSDRLAPGTRLIKHFNLEARFCYRSAADDLKEHKKEALRAMAA